MRRVGLGFLLITAILSANARAQAPAAPSFHSVEQAVGKIRAGWARPGAAAQPNATGWNAIFDALLGDLHAYAAATTDAGRLGSLSSIYQISTALGSVTWQPAVDLREALREWLRPRVRLAWAERRLVDRLQSMPPAPDAQTQSNRDKWRTFVANDLGSALRQYDASSTVAKRHEALQSIYSSLNALRTRNQTSVWRPSIDLQAALNDLYNLPNLDISIDVDTLAPAFNVNLVTNGPVSRKGYLSQITAGPKTGFGLLTSDNGITFFNSQLMKSVTPIHDFQRQVENNPQGKRAAKMYLFNATTLDSSELFIYTAIRTTGLQIWPAYKHHVSADINTTPQDRGKLPRAIASLLGYNQAKITQMAWQNAIGKITSNVEAESMEEGTERTSREAASRNTQLAQYLIGGDRAVFRNVMIEGLSLRSRPANALIGGKIEYLNAQGQVGADIPQPPAFSRPDSGVSADLHLSSIMTNFTRGYLQSDRAQGVENLMVVTKPIPPGAPPAEGVKVSQNTDYPTFLSSVQASKALNDPKALTIRVKRPTTPPAFGADARGHLVAIIKDFQLDVPAPPAAAKGGLAGPPARVYRLTSPQVEFVISFQVSPKSEKEPLRLTGRVEDMNPGPNAKVFALNEDESQAVPLTSFTSNFVLGVFRSKVRGQPLDIPLSNVQLRGFGIHSVSPLDPSGWIRVNLVRTSDSPAAGIQAPGAPAGLLPNAPPSPR